MLPCCSPPPFSTPLSSLPSACSPSPELRLHRSNSLESCWAQRTGPVCRQRSELGLQLGPGTLCSLFPAARSLRELPSAAGVGRAKRVARTRGNTALCPRRGTVGRGGHEGGLLEFPATKAKKKSHFKQKNMSAKMQERRSRE